MLTTDVDGVDDEEPSTVLSGKIVARVGAAVTGAIVTMAGGVHASDMLWVVATEKMGVDGVDTTVVGITVRAPQARMAFSAAGSCVDSGEEFAAGAGFGAALDVFGAPAAAWRGTAGADRDFVGVTAAEEAVVVCDDVVDVC